MPKMEGMLGNWMLHGQNLGTMLKNYKRQYRHLPPSHRRELSQFFSTTLTVLDTIESMTENAILRSVQFEGNNHDGSGLTGGEWTMHLNQNYPRQNITYRDMWLSSRTTS